ncbi:MAG: tetratricopeptide repeat protein [Dehalococcoidia bacterium]|nr:tetratricopeptide repeat protein [Dehalococcoidia bacterium]
MSGQAHGQDGGKKRAYLAHNTTLDRDPLPRRATAIRLDPDDALAYNNRGNAYYYLGEYQRAIQDYDKAIQLDPDYRMAYFNRGNAYDDLGQYQRAIQDYDKACSLDSKYC